MLIVSVLFGTFQGNYQTNIFITMLHCLWVYDAFCHTEQEERRSEQHQVKEEICWSLRSSSEVWLRLSELLLVFTPKYLFKEFNSHIFSAKTGHNNVTLETF